MLGVLIGTFAWLLGHWLFAVRHQAFWSPPARRIFLQLLPTRLDPIRRWGTRTVN